MKAAFVKPSEESHYEGGEPVRGLPARLPVGEAMLWQGSPEWRAMALRVFHVRKVAIYFGLLLAWDVASALMGGQGLARELGSLLDLVGLAALAVGILCLLSWGISRSTVYTITSRRVVIRAGLAVPKSINLPYSRLASAGLRPYNGGCGDILLTPLDGEKIAYLLLWPHLDAWKFANARPKLRVVADAASVAAILGEAMLAECGTLPVAAARIAVRLPGLMATAT